LVGRQVPASREESPKAPDTRKSPTIIPSSQSPPRAAGQDVDVEAEAEAAKFDNNFNKSKKATTRKATKTKAIVKDKVIELDSGDLMKSRDAYSDEMKKLNDVKRLEKEGIMQVKMARMCIFQVPLQIHAPEIRDCE